MKIGVFTALMNDWSLEACLAHLSALGVEQVELGTGGYPGKSHLNPDILLNDASALDQVRRLLDHYRLTISALSCHSNPVHPDPSVAEEAHNTFERTVMLAQKLGVGTIVSFSGCPGDGMGGKRPNWVTCAWPNEFADILRYQWNDVLVPYWRRALAFAHEHGVHRIAIEMHPGFCVYNPESLLSLRSQVGDGIGANFDPSHLFWQGIDPLRAIKVLDKAIFHFHAKDCHLEDACKLNGVLDCKPHYEVRNRSWLFRTVGYGHSEEVWRNMISALKVIGYNGSISIEHEDPLMDADEGLRKAIALLKSCIIRS